MGITGYGPYDSDLSAEWLEARVHEAVDDLDKTDNTEEVRAIVAFIAWSATQVNAREAVDAAAERMAEELQDPGLTPDYADAMRAQLRQLEDLRAQHAARASRPRSMLRKR